MDPVGQITTTSVEERRPLYEDVSTLLNVGFLSQPIQIDTINLCLRSPNQGDFFLIKCRVGLDPDDRKWQCWALATCTWLFEGQTLLEEVSAPLRLYNFYRGLPDNVVVKLFTQFTDLHNRVLSAMERVEAYSYEAHSRFLWHSVGSKIGSEVISGIPGGDRVGQNLVQQLWVSLNVLEDMHIASKSQWEASKLVASAMAPKGIQALNSSDREREKGEKERRQKVMDTLYYKVKGVPVKEVLSVSYQATTEDELIEEMRRATMGEKDWHDKIVDRYKAQLQERFEARQAELLEQQRKFRQVREEAMQQASTNEGSIPVAYTPEQVEQLLRDQGVTTTRSVYDGRNDSTNPNSLAAYLMERNVSKKVQAGGLKFGPNMNDPSSIEVMPITTQEEGSSLQDKIQNRRVEVE